MKAPNTDQLIEKLQNVVNHVGIFESSYPKILKNAPIYSRSHLIVFYEVLPQLKHLMKFASSAIPLIIKIMGIATEGKSDLSKASEHLHNINESSESAVTEIFAALDQVGNSLRTAQQAKNTDDDFKTTLNEANNQLMAIMNALQFQDITSQKIEATNALLAHLGDGLVDLVSDLGLQSEGHGIRVREGSFDETAAFDRTVADSKQEEIDGLLNAELSDIDLKSTPEKTSSDSESTEQPLSGENGGANPLTNVPPSLPPTTKNGQSHNTNVQEEEAVSADDIDDLIGATIQENQVEEKAVSSDDIDDLIGATIQENQASEETIDQDDIDSLINSQ